MKKLMRKAIADGEYNLGIAWEHLDIEDRNALLSWVRAHSNYGKDAHMGMMPLLAAKTIFMVLDRADRDIRYGYEGGYQSKLVERIRAIIRLQIKRDMRLKEHLAKMRAKERHTA